MTDFWLLDLLALLGAASLMCTLGVVAWVIVESITEERRARELAELDARVDGFHEGFAAWQAAEVDRVWNTERAA